ncbi:hypothetical protein P8C59_005849 [Phyllachora maydis]|uniref:Zn(2)-C6 fungal-type domain-containing protein n=1 Tax=Phyllachora maydis TaxID=1825666 RepID=A0AAD9I587_9PEZI|nr:hypothetical protein P8C59_005849 [Phyllachora maydis]
MPSTSTSTSASSSSSKRKATDAENPSDDPASALPEPPKRQRVSRACDQCRAAREKCDGIQPQCHPCLSQNRPCTYQVGGNFSSRQKKEAETIDYTGGGGRARPSFSGPPLDYDAILDDLGSLDYTDRIESDQQFMANLGFAPGCDLADILTREFGAAWNSSWY